MLIATHTPDELLGEWTLHRTIDDRAHDQHGAASGTAVLTADGPNRIRWSEQGTLEIADRTSPFHRNLVIDRATESSPWIVRFEDNRDFHEWVTAEPIEYDCAPDTYYGLFQIDSDCSQWRTEWQVDGPAKHYLMDTTYTAAAAGQTARKPSTP